MSMAYIRKFYGVPAKRGARVEYTGGNVPVTGTIVGSDNSGRLRVRMDGKSHAGIYHPTWEIRYLPAPPSPTQEQP